MLLGCIADDFTGATDLANNLVRSGMRCVLTNGVPVGAAPADADAVVVALKSRTIAAEQAVAQSLQALAWLQAGGARQIYFKICSTFDSTDDGNIGPVTEALMKATGASFSIACPAFPENNRTIFKGYLFAGDVLLNESGMQNHPLTPMRDANLVRVMQRQCRAKVGLIDYRHVQDSAAAIGTRMRALKDEGVTIAICDATSNDDLMRLGAAVRELPVITAGSGVAIGLPQNFGIAPSAQAASLPDVGGRAAILSGSCSLATQTQVAAHREAGRPALALDVDRIVRGESMVSVALDWFAGLPSDAVALIYSTADAERVRAVQDEFGVEESGRRIETTLAAIAVGMVGRDVRRLVVAGGETAGAVVQALALEQLRIGAQIDPGVPWCAATSPAAGGQTLKVALKSGNFGAPDFFMKAFER